MLQNIHLRAGSKCIMRVQLRNFAAKSTLKDLHGFKYERKDHIGEDVLAQNPNVWYESHPRPIRKEFMRKDPLSTKDLEAIDVRVGFHRVPVDWRSKIAWGIVRSLRIPADLFFRNKYVHRAVMLETVAAVPGMVAGMLRHLDSLRGLRHDNGWIHHLLNEAENERMHLMTWMKLSEPNWWERGLVMAVQGVAFNLYFLAYLASPRIAHRFTGYLEEEAILSYSAMLQQIDDGKIANGPAPPIAVKYWNLHKNATIRDVCLAIRADESCHRDVNHLLSDRISANRPNLREEWQSATPAYEDKSWSSISHTTVDLQKEKKRIKDAGGPSITL